jgi:aminopeptidase N
MGHDRDKFNRWEAGQTRGRELILASIGGVVPEKEAKAYASVLGQLLADPSIDDAFKALMLGLPPEADIAAAIGKDVDTDAVLAARDGVRAALGALLDTSLTDVWNATAEAGPYTPDPAGTARRALRYAALQMILLDNRGQGVALALQELANPHSMTAEIGALSGLIQVEAPEREIALQTFFTRHAADHLLVDKWFMLQAQAKDAHAAARVERLSRHPAFTYGTPNRVYALIGGFTSGNVAGFNAADGEGYRVVADAVIKLDGFNPQVAARMATGFRSCPMLNAPRRAAAHGQLQRILAAPKLSRDCFEIISRIAKGLTA